MAGTTSSRHQLSLQLPIVLDATTAKRIAERTLVAAWLERSAYEAQLPPDRLALEPTDVIDVVFPSGSAFRTRLTRVDVGADYTLALQGVSETTASFVSSAIADGGQGRLPQAIAGDAATRLILVDLPLLRDADDTGGTGSRLYYLMAGYGAPGWPGAALYRSADGSAWTQTGRALGEAAWGAAANALGSPTSPFSTDEVNSLTVFMTTGGERLESVTQEAMLAGANAALLLKSNGEPEILQFRDVTLNPDGSYTLSGLLRGRRGTDVFVDGHQAGELFVLLDADDIETLVVPLGELGLSRSWRAVGFGSLFEDAETVVRSHTGRDLMPLAPVHVAGSRDGSGDLAITWVRRTRIGGELKDGTGTVPLGEAIETYEVDILDGPDGDVVRTLDGLTGPTATYTAAEQTADFGSPQPVVHLRVFQLSAVDRPGFSHNRESLMPSPNLAIPHVAASQNQKEVTINDAIDALDLAMTAALEIDVTGGGHDRRRRQRHAPSCGGGAHGHASCCGHPAAAGSAQVPLRAEHHRPGGHGWRSRQAAPRCRWVPDSGSSSMPPAATSCRSRRRWAPRASPPAATAMAATFPGSPSTPRAGSPASPPCR